MQDLARLDNTNAGLDQELDRYYGEPYQYHGRYEVQSTLLADVIQVAFSENAELRVYLTQPELHPKLKDLLVEQC